MSDIEQTKSGQKSRTGREWINTLRSAKVIWAAGIVIILVGVLLVLVSPPPSCGYGCEVIKGEVLEEGVETIGQTVDTVKTEHKCNTTRDCPYEELLNKYERGCVCVCRDNFCYVNICGDVSKPNTYSVKVLKVYHGELKEGQEIIVNNYDRGSEGAKKLYVGKTYKLVLYDDIIAIGAEEKADADVWLFDSQKELLRDYSTGKLTLRLYILEISQPESGSVGFVILVLLCLVILVFVSLLFIIKGNIFMRFVTSIFIVVFVIPATLLPFHPDDRAAFIFIELLFLTLISFVFMIFKIIKKIKTIKL